MVLTIGGKEYTFRQLRYKHIAELKAIFRGRRKSQAIEWIVGLPPEMQAEATREATRQAMGDAGFAEWQASDEGLGEMLLRTLKQDHPEIKTAADALEVLMKIPETMYDEIIGMVTGLDAAKN